MIRKGETAWSTSLQLEQLQPVLSFKRSNEHSFVNFHHEPGVLFFHLKFKDYYEKYCDKMFYASLTRAFVVKRNLMVGYQKMPRAKQPFDFFKK